eukprot:4495357-Pyramimonas_sp.AAC.1
MVGNTDLAGVARFMHSGISGGVGWSQQACLSVSVPAGVSWTPAGVIISLGVRRCAPTGSNRRCRCRSVSLKGLVSGGKSWRGYKHTPWVTQPRFPIRTAPPSLSIRGSSPNQIREKGD